MGEENFNTVDQLDIRHGFAEHLLSTNTNQNNLRMEHMNTKRKMLVGLVVGLSAILSPVTFAQGDCKVEATAVVTNPTCGLSNGFIDLTPFGGVAPYYFTWSTGSTNEDLSGVTSGSYWVVVEDWNKCMYKLDIDVYCDEDENCQFRTQTQGGWGAKPSGNNPAMYLQNHWSSCFPNGITIGCAGMHTLTLTSSTAVKNFLPAGSVAGQLTNDLVNPLSSPAGVLAGQLVAAVINVTVDNCDPNFGSATTALGDAVYVGGPFDGMTVSDVIAAANNFIGGCGGSYTATQFNEALTDLNENYDNGTGDNGHFDCGRKEEKSMISGSLMDRAVVYPNPATQQVMVDLTFMVSGRTELSIMDLTGRIVNAGTSFGMEAGEARIVSMDVSGLTSGTYLIVVKRDGNTVTRPVVIAH